MIVTADFAGRIIGRMNIHVKCAGKQLVENTLIRGEELRGTDVPDMIDDLAQREALDVRAGDRVGDVNMNGAFRRGKTAETQRNQAHRVVAIQTDGGNTAGESLRSALW